MSEHTRNQKRMYRIHKQEEKILEQELMIAHLQQKVEQLENTRKEAIQWIDEHDYYSGSSDIYYFSDFTPSNDLLNILNKGEKK